VQNGGEEVDPLTFDVKEELNQEGNKNVKLPEDVADYETGPMVKVQRTNSPGDGTLSRKFANTLSTACAQDSEINNDSVDGEKRTDMSSPGMDAISNNSYNMNNGSDLYSLTPDCTATQHPVPMTESDNYSGTQEQETTASLKSNAHRVTVDECLVEDPDLFTVDKMINLCENVCVEAPMDVCWKMPGDIWDYFIKRIRNNLHFVLHMLIISEVFREDFVAKRIQ
jgi:hypothetical protein